MTTALIGYTGFVGSNILAARAFDDLYNSSNIGEIAGRRYDLVVSAANAADSYRINQHPDEDLASIDAFAGTVTQAEIGTLVLISTVCVYAESERSDENTPITTDEITPYGRNRFHLEQVLADRFRTTILRLPQLFGSGLKKGIVYDLANAYRVEHIRPEGRFQYYGLDRLWNDAEVALRNGLSVLNVATPPISNARVAAECFDIDISSQVPAEPESPFSRMYTRNMTTIHSGLFGRDDGYLIGEIEELASIRSFVAGLQDANA
jgi:nucleoside-diphosphate-sugar epimerase